MPRFKPKHYDLSQEQQREHDELLVRISVHAEEMRQNKSQQWRTLYYTMLLLAAMVLAFQQPVNLGVLYYWLKAIAIVVVILIGIASIIHLLALKYEIELNRAAARSMEEELHLLTGVSGRLGTLHKAKYDAIVNAAPRFLRWLPSVLTCERTERKLNNVLFYALFIGIVVLAACSVVVLIAFDT